MNPVQVLQERSTVHLNVDFLTINEAALSRFGNRVSPFSVRRWISQGVGRPPVKLRAIRVGGRYFLRECDISEFLQATADPDLYRRRKRVERVERAKQRLREAGA